MKIFRFFLISFFFLPLVSFAQSIPGIASPISIDMSPVSPGPGDVVTLTANSSSFDVNSVLLTWTVGGKVISQGDGDKTVILSAPALGVKTIVNISAEVPGLGTFTASQTISPALVNLIWEAQTSVPPFYEGKALLGWGATYKVVAEPEISENGILVDPAHLVYTWSKNYSVDTNQSGYGKNSYQSDGAINYVRGGDTVSLSVATQDGSVSTQGSVTISPITPTVSVYLESPLYGILYNQSLAETSLSGDSITLHAEPFFFSDVSSVIGSLIWNMNSVEVPGFTGNRSITFVRQDKNAGTSVVEAILQSPTAMLQQGQRSVTIDINAEK